LDWCYAGDKRFSEPLFDQTIDRIFNNPFAATFRRSTSLDELKAIHAEAPGLAPDCLIFHMSRCGSTALAQTLATLACNIVIAEPSLLDSLLRANIAEELKATWLSLIVSALGRRQHGESCYFLKLSGWHILDFALFRRAFPETPAIFLYGDPVDVLSSHSRYPSLWALPGYLDCIPEADADVAMTLDEYRARLLASILTAALVSDAIPVNFKERPSLAWDLLSKLIHRDFAPGEIEALRQSASSACRERDCPAPLMDLAQRFLEPLHEQFKARSRVVLEEVCATTIS
jgi:hypothetical protein